MKNITVVIIGFCILFGNAYASSSPMELAPLKAVLIVGPQEDATAGSIESMEKIAVFLRGKGVSVKTFYSESNWVDITTAANGAHFFIYNGHGSRQGGNGKAGGLCISSASIIPSNKIVTDVKLAPHAMVIFQSVCHGAGSSADDKNDIGINEATVRVTDYAQPFFKVGAGCYYANNLGDGCLKFLQNFFEGKNIKECFEISAQTWCKIEKIEPCVVAPNAQVGIASKHWGGTSTVTTYVDGIKKVEELASIKQYDIAFVGNAAFSIAKMQN